MSNNEQAKRIDILKQLPPFMPQFLRKRRVGLPRLDEITRELDIERSMFFVMRDLDLLQGSYDGPVTLSRFRAENPYRVIDTRIADLSVLVGKGLVLQDHNDAYHLSKRAKEMVDRSNEAGREYVARWHPLPDDELEKLASQLARAQDAVLSNPVLGARPGSRLRGSHSQAVFGSDAPAMVRIEQAIFDLWMGRDDAHVKAWRDAGLEGPPMAVLGLLWSGEAETLARLQEALRDDQTPKDVEGSITFLVEKEYATRDGESVQLTPAGVLVREDIERETDRIYFDGWPHSREESAWLVEKLQELIENMTTPPG